MKIYSDNELENLKNLTNYYNYKDDYLEWKDDCFNEIEKFIIQNKKIVYGGYALILNICQKDNVYNKKFNDIDIYTCTPKQDLNYLIEIFKEKKYCWKVRASNARHIGTFTLFINEKKISDISYIDYENFIKIPIIKNKNGLKFVNYNMIYLDYFSILSDIESTFSMTKVIERIKILQTYYPYNNIKSNVNDFITYIKNDKFDINDIINRLIYFLKNKFVIPIDENKYNFKYFFDDEKNKNIDLIINNSFKIKNNNINNDKNMNNGENGDENNNKFVNDLKKSLYNPKNISLESLDTKQKKICNLNSDHLIDKNDIQSEIILNNFLKTYRYGSGKIDEEDENSISLIKPFSEIYSNIEKNGIKSYSKYVNLENNYFISGLYAYNLYHNYFNNNENIIDNIEYIDIYVSNINDTIYSLCKNFLKNNEYLKFVKKSTWINHYDFCVEVFLQDKNGNEIKICNLYETSKKRSFVIYNNLNISSFTFLLSFFCLEGSINKKNNYKLYTKCIYNLLLLKQKKYLDDIFISISQTNNIGLINSQYMSNLFIVEKSNNNKLIDQINEMNKNISVNVFKNIDETP